MLAAHTFAVVEINYWLWDANQYPAYADASRAFNQKNPDIRVRVTQIGWDSYWISLTTSLISEAAPDVFANHLSRFPQLLKNHTLADLSPYADRDGVRPEAYVGTLFQSWAKDDGLYGIPKDWDTVAIAYNTGILQKAGIAPDELGRLTWNPEDGGTFGQLLARLTLDETGANGLSPEYDSTRTALHGLLMDGRIDGFGQSQWSSFAVSNGFRFNDGPWSREFNYENESLAETLEWLREAQRKGFVVPAEHARQLGAVGLLAAEKGALAMAGSWQVKWLQTNCRFDVGFAPLPIGPEGRRSMFNGLGDSMWVGTEHPEEAWRWLKFLGSHEGQMIIANRGVVFPAIMEAAERATEVMSAGGSDVSIYLEQAITPDGTFPFPTTDFGSEILEITRIWMDRIFLDGANIDASLRDMNAEVNRCFGEDW